MLINNLPFFNVSYVLIQDNRYNDIIFVIQGDCKLRAVRKDGSNKVSFIPFMFPLITGIQVIVDYLNAHPASSAG